MHTTDILISLCTFILFAWCLYRRPVCVDSEPPKLLRARLDVRGIESALRSFELQYPMFVKAADEANAFSKVFFVMSVYFVFVLVFYILSLIVPFVAAADESYAGTFLNNNAAHLIQAASIMTAVLTKKIDDAVGMTPAKNFAKLRRLAATCGNESRVIFWAFTFSHHSANPAVWKRIYDSIVPGDLGPDATMLDDFKKAVPGGANAFFVWAKANVATTDSQFRTSSILGSNPSFAAYTWMLTMCTENVTYEHFIAQRWSAAMNVTPDVMADIENTQKKFVTEVLGLPWKSAFFRLSSRSTFWFFNHGAGARYAYTATSKTGMSPDGIVDWINQNKGRSAQGTTPDKQLLAAPVARVPAFTALKAGST